MANPPATTPPARALVVLWGLALGLLMTAVTAPVRPWGWQGGSTLGSAFLIAVLALGATPGLPPRRLLVPIAAAALAVLACFRVLLPWLRDVAS